jgi:hypothetical protein
LERQQAFREFILEVKILSPFVVFRFFFLSFLFFRAACWLHIKQTTLQTASAKAISRDQSATSVWVSKRVCLRQTLKLALAGQDCVHRMDLFNEAAVFG